MRLEGKIYLRAGSGGLVEMTEARYDAEEELQRLLAEYPDLLAGDQMDPAAPRRWLLIEREAPIEDTAGGMPRWSLDHLFLDQEARPTLIEVKRSSDTRLRREVVGQMLDYAANVVAHWPAGELRRRYEARLRASGVEDRLPTLLGGPPDPEAIDTFWASADANLAARRLRLVFVADVIPQELLRIIEFLNETMAEIDVLGVEVRQFVGEGHVSLVPRVVGRTATAAKRKEATSSRTIRRWTLEEFRAEADSVGGPGARRVIDPLVRWADGSGVEVQLGQGKYGPLYPAVALPAGGTARIVNVNTAGLIMVSFDVLAKHPPFDDVDARLEACRRLNDVPGISIDERYARTASWPAIRPEALAVDGAVEGLVGVLEWIRERLQGAQPRTVPPGS